MGVAGLKTVCGVSYYELDVGRRAEMLELARNAFSSLLRDDLVQVDGQVLLGTHAVRCG